MKAGGGKSISYGLGFGKLNLLPNLFTKFVTALRSGRNTLDFFAVLSLRVANADICFSFQIVVKHR